VSIDRRFLAPVLITMILVVGQVTAGFLESGFRTFLAIATAVLVEAVLGRAFTGRWPHLASAYVSGISVGILVRSPEIWPYALCSALAISSKYLIRMDNRHIWNPSNFAIVALLVLAPDVVASLSVQWGNQLWAMVPVWCVGALVLSTLGRLHITATYVAAFVALAVVRTWMTGDPWLAEVAPITGPMYQLFACFMVTDPKTTVQTRSGQVGVVLVVAGVEALLRLAEVVHAPYYALFLVGPVANVVEIMKARVQPRVVRAVAGVLMVWIAAGCGGPVPAPTTAAGMQFVEAAAEAGLDFQHLSGASGRFYFVEQWGAGAAFLDVDQDGWIDLFLAQGGPLPGFTGAGRGARLYRNRGNGTFMDITGAGLTSTPYTLGTASADYDNDGDPDLFLTTVDGARLYENVGGLFTDVTAVSGIRVNALATSAAFIDYDGDGRLDVFVGRYQDYALHTDEACTPGHTFPPPQHAREYCGPGRPVVPSQLFRNEGGGRFRDVSAESRIAASPARALGVVAADLNGDGRTDLFVASDRAPNLLFINRGGGTFVESAAAAGVAVNRDGVAYAGMGVDAADYDNDGHIDLIVTNYEQEPTTLFHNAGNGLFTEVSDRVGLTPRVFKFMKWGVRLLDFDTDGRKDLLMANGHLFPHLEEGTPLGLPIEQTRKGYAQEVQVFQQTNDGQFVERSVSAGPFFAERRVFRGAATADIDNDGDWDAVVTAVDGKVALLRNETPARAWAGLRLQGVASNRDAIGATVVVTTGAGRQTFVITSGGSYLSEHDRRVNVALGDGTEAAAEIRWPCGSTTTVALPASVVTVAREAGCAPRRR
jgi:FG-GAP-like repeat/ASPIC and UnbV